MQDWNVVVTVHEEGFKRACELLDSFGALQPTHYHNVLVMKVEDIRAFLDRLSALVTNVPDVLDIISRAVPAAKAFDFTDAVAFEAQARAVAMDWLPQLAGKTFYVRLHRRGLKGTLKTPTEERFLDEALLDGLAAAGNGGHISFDDPDVVIDVETIDNRASLSIWTRDELDRYPFLKVG